MRALIVEDSRATGTIFGRILGSLGFQWDQANDGVEAMAGQKVPMVATEVDRRDCQGALDAGADDSLSKPFTAENLADRLRNLGVLEVSFA